jgi:GntR family transcriptional regulator / MocR family aminotransferase
MRPVPGDLTLVLRPRGPAYPTYRQLYAALRDAILDGRLRPGVKLPSTRELADRYSLARGTIVIAFEQLKSEGYLSGRVGSGTYVSEVLPEALLHAGYASASAGAGARGGTRAGTRVRKTGARPRQRRLSDVAKRAVAFKPSLVPASHAFRANQPALDLFPTTLWAQVAGRRLRRASTTLLKGCPPCGYPPLQQALADYLGASRGVICAPEQIAIVSGVQEAIDLTARLVLNPGDVVCFEDPGYMAAARAFAAAGASMMHVPLDDEGMTVPRRSRSHVRGGRDARLAYVTPAHQFPMGMTMSLARRLALLHWARRTGALIFEDDYDSEYRFAGTPVPALQSLDRDGCVLFAGSFSKVLFPSLRIGYLVVPPDLVDRVEAIKSLANRHSPVIDQAVLCDFMTEGHFGRHVRRMREVYADRLTALLRAVRGELGDHVEVSPVEAGLQTPVTFRRDIDGVAMREAAARRGVEVFELSRYGARPLARDGLLLGFASVDAAEIRRGVKELAAIFRQETPCYRTGIR